MIIITIYITYNYLYNVLVINSNVQNLNTKYYYCQKVSAKSSKFCDIISNILKNGIVFKKVSANQAIFVI
jgi:hypothetical protein